MVYIRAPFFVSVGGMFNAVLDEIFYGSALLAPLRGGESSCIFF